jgi:putative transposase
MVNVFQSLLLVIAGATEKELARQVKYLKMENEVLRSKLPKRITITSTERQRLVRFAKKLGRALNQFTTIVTPGTLRRWIREEKKHGKKPRGKRGRQRTPEQIRLLILKLARENQWGYTRILGELKKLGICSISRNTVKRILKDSGLDPGPKRGEGTLSPVTQNRRGMSFSSSMRRRSGNVTFSPSAYSRLKVFARRMCWPFCT